MQPGAFDPRHEFFAVSGNDDLVGPGQVLDLFPIGQSVDKDQNRVRFGDFEHTDRQLEELGELTRQFLIFHPRQSSFQARFSDPSRCASNPRLVPPD